MKTNDSIFILPQIQKVKSLFEGRNFFGSVSLAHIQISWHSTTIALCHILGLFFFGLYKLILNIPTVLGSYLYRVWLTGITTVVKQLHKLY